MASTGLPFVGCKEVRSLFYPIRSSFFPEIPCFEIFPYGVDPGLAGSPSGSFTINMETGGFVDAIIAALQMIKTETSLTSMGGIWSCVQRFE